MIAKFKTKIKNKVNAIKYAQKKNRFFDDIGLKEERKKYSKELKELKLISYVKEEQRNFSNYAVGKEIRGSNFVFGGLGEQESKDLYFLIRYYKPSVIVETGVCNGVSSFIILHALSKNKKGKLISIDLPEIEGLVYKDNRFWTGKGGAVIPKGKEPGWIVPDNLRDNWELHLGKSQDLLEDILSKEEDIDVFIHDSEHSYDCMSFEYKCAFPHIKKGGLLISDDIFANDAFGDFISNKKGSVYYLSRGVGILIKEN